MMTVQDFDKLTRRDFENGAVLDEIRASLKEAALLNLTLDVATHGIDTVLLYGMSKILHESEIPLSSQQRCTFAGCDSMGTERIVVKATKAYIYEFCALHSVEFKRDREEGKE